MKEYELKQSNIGEFLADIRNNVRSGHYIKAVTIDGVILLGKVTYITSNYIYINKGKTDLRQIFLIIRLSKKTYELECNSLGGKLRK